MQREPTRPFYNPIEHYNRLFEMINTKFEFMRMRMEVSNREYTILNTKLDHITYYNKTLLEEIDMLKKKIDSSNLDNEIAKLDKKISDLQLETNKKTTTTGVNTNNTNFEILGKKTNPKLDGVIFQMENNNTKHPLGSFFGSLVFLINKKKEKENKKEEEEDEKEEEEISEYDSDEKFEELDINMTNGKINDLIKLGALYNTLKQKKQQDDDNFIKNNPFKKMLKKKLEDSETSSSEKEEDSEDDEDNNEEQNENNNDEQEESDPDQEQGQEQGQEQEQDQNKDLDKSKKSINIEAIRKKSSAFELNGKKYGINLKILNDLVKPLKKLEALVGLDSVKDAIIDMILYFLQNFEKGNDNMLHTVIEGPPGVGKTELGKILAEIYCSLGIIKSNKFKVVKRSDLIGEYLGQTAIKTQKAIDDVDGGVLFIDEAYALGHSEKRDSYSKECLDTLNQNLSERKRKFICIIAGYATELNECFFGSNQGLKRRFPFKFKITGYEPNELKLIFEKKVKDSRWILKCDNDKLLRFFKDNKYKFPFYGGDMETLLIECKFCHSRRVVGQHPKERRKLTDDDIKKGFSRFLGNKKNNDEIPLLMYS